MKDLVEYIIKQLVSKPDAVAVDESIQDTTITLVLKVDPQDMGLVIGKGGQMIKAVRKLLTIRAMAENVRVFLQLAEPAQAASVATE